MKIIQMLKGLFHSTWFAASQHDRMTEHTAQDVVSPYSALIKKTVVAVTNFHAATGILLTKEELRVAFALVMEAQEAGVDISETDACRIFANMVLQSRSSAALLKK